MSLELQKGGNFYAATIFPSDAQIVFFLWLFPARRSSDAEECFKDILFRYARPAIALDICWPGVGLGAGVVVESGRLENEGGIRNSWRQIIPVGGALIHWRHSS